MLGTPVPAQPRTACRTCSLPGYRSRTRHRFCSFPQALLLTVANTAGRAPAAPAYDALLIDMHRPHPLTLASPSPRPLVSQLAVTRPLALRIRTARHSVPLLRSIYLRSSLR